MFGRLFEEEDEAEFNCTTAFGTVDKGLELPPPARGKSNLSGIKNQGGTCYLNSLLQTLLFTPEFREKLFSLGHEELGLLEDKENPEAKVRVIPLELQRLFARLLLVDQQSASTTRLTDSFGWTNNEETNQHDVQELNRILFSALERSLVGTSGSSLIHKLYHGTIVNKIVCGECGNVSQRQEDFLDLTACVSGMDSLESALKAMFVDEEKFEGKNLYQCEKCDRLVTAAKSTKLQELPPFITMSLLRFSFDFTKCVRYKETGRCTFPLTINLRPFCEQSDGEDSEFSYELFSVIIHKGGCYGGHYHAYIRDIDQLGQWEPTEEDSKNNLRKTLEDVEVVEEVQEVHELQQPQLDFEDPLCLLIVMIHQEPSKSILLDQLGLKVLRKTGSSWGKRFRKQHGPIGKFLQSHSDVFILVSNGTRVALKADPPSTTTACSKPAELTQPSPAPPPGPEGDHWFDLNDSTVTSIRESDLERQFEGTESAYMLFYRKSHLPRPTEAFRNPVYKVPPELVLMAAEENVDLQQRRQDFGTFNNTVELSLHLAPSYRLENGALRPMSKNQHETTFLSFDPRKTVGDLRLMVYQMLEHWEGDMALTVAKSLPAGLHLYTTLTDDSVSLYSAGIVNSSDLFVWNGREVAGVPVHTGAEWEPVLLSVVRPYLTIDGGAGVEEEGEGGDVERAPVQKWGPGLIKENRGFACTATLEEVREALREPQESMLCQRQAGRKGGDGGRPEGGGARPEGGGASHWEVFPPTDLRRTLRDLALKDGDELLVLEPQSLNSGFFSVSGKLVTMTVSSDCCWLQVKSRLHCLFAEDRQAWDWEEKMTAILPASVDMSIGEVKQRAMDQMELNKIVSGIACCLRPIDHTGKHLLPPVCEELSVWDAGVWRTDTLFLCLGPAPTATQLYLKYCFTKPSSDGLKMDIVVEQTCTANECLRIMLQTVGLKGSIWQLSTIDSCGRVRPIRNKDASLTELNIISGSTLVITRAQLPPKGDLKLSIWLLLKAGSELAPSADADSSHAVEGSSKDVIASRVLEAGVPGATLRSIGKVEIPDEATLEDLKIQVMRLPALQSVCVPSPDFLRIWQLEGRTPVRIYRGQQRALRMLRVTSGAELCVQPLLSEEDLGPKEVLLHIKIAKLEDGSFYPAEEVVWSAKYDPSLNSLSYTLAAHFDLPPKTLLLAKLHPDHNSWHPISSWSQVITNSKRKKTSESLLTEPYCLKDGDTIGVKSLLLDSPWDFCPLEDCTWDFCTEEDLQDQHRLSEEAEQYRKRAECSEAVVQKTDSSKEKTAEACLSINVGSFQ